MEDLGFTVLEILAPVIVAALTWLAAKVSKLIQAKIGNEYLQGVLLRLNDSVFMVVKEIKQTIVDEIKLAKDPKSPGGMSLTDDEKRAIKAQAMSSLKSYLGAKGLAELGKVLGLGQSALDSFLSSRIEAAVADANRGKL